MLNRFTSDYLESLGIPDFTPSPKISGRLASFDGLLMEAVGLTLPVGTVCQVGTRSAGVEAEVIGFRNGRTLLMNLAAPRRWCRKCRCARSALRARRRLAWRCSAGSSMAPVARSTG